MVRSALVVCVALSLVACKGKESYAEMARKANAARSDAGEPVKAYPPDATLLAGKQNGPRQISVDGDGIYWLNDGSRGEGQPGIMKLPKSGGELTPLLKSDQVVSIAADASSVYFIVPRAGQVAKVAKSGGQPTVLAETQGMIRALAIDDTDVYWAEEEALYRVPKAGGKAQVAVKDASLVDYLVADEGNLYWYGSISGSVMRASKKGGGPARIHNDDKHTLHTIFIDGADLYFSFGAAKKMELYRMPKGGGTPAQVVGGQEPGSDFATDSSHIYWASEDGIFKVARSGGSVTQVVAKADRIRNLAVDGSHVYWTDRGGRVQKMAK
jgi:hypothetical protein